MRRSDFETLRASGLYIKRDFFSPGVCGDLRSEAGARPREAATIVSDGEVVVDPTVRLAECFDIDDNGLRNEVQCRLVGVRPELAVHFEIDLSSFEPPQVIRYPTGGFYRPHKDNEGRASNELGEVCRRRVSCVVFLNGAGSSASDGGFVGGALAFFRLARSPTAENCKTFLYPEPNLLVAFKSETYHEVLLVAAGVRWTLATWFQ